MPLSPGRGDLAKLTTPREKSCALLCSALAEHRHELCGIAPIWQLNMCSPPEWAKKRERGKLCVPHSEHKWQLPAFVAFVCGWATFNGITTRDDDDYDDTPMYTDRCMLRMYVSTYICCVNACCGSHTFLECSFAMTGVNPFDIDC